MGILEEKDLQFIKKNHKWRFVWTDIFVRYSILIAPIFFILISLLLFCSINLNKESTIPIATIFLLIGCFLFYFIAKRIESERQFRIIPFSKNEYLKLQECLNKLEWQVLARNAEIITAFTKFSFFSRSGLEQNITIIIEDNQLLFNSRPGGVQAFTINNDIINYRKLKNILKQ